jgi:predicted alpha/beta superfamily hydrolase
VLNSHEFDLIQIVTRTFHQSQQSSGVSFASPYSPSVWSSSGWQYTVCMVEFVLRSPTLNPWDAVYVTGDCDALGGWSADAVRLDWRDSAFRACVDLPAGSHFRYLFTRGNWRSAQLDSAGAEQVPQLASAQDGMRIEREVATWGRNSVRYHGDFASQHLPHARTLIVHLPPGYDLQANRRYPVLYLQDGQNLFDANTSFAGVPWGCDETAERLARAGEIAPLILVGVSNSPDRLREYGPKPDEPDNLTEAYARFLIHEVRPFINREYRTQTAPEFTGVGGSSMGGLISLQLCRQHPEVFGICAALSASLWWDNERLLREVEADLRGLAGCRIWLDMGGREGHSDAGMAAMVRRARRLAHDLKSLPKERFRYYEDPDASHNETAWASRFPDVLRFLAAEGVKARLPTFAEV